MLVYGDPHFDAPLRALRERVRTRLEATRPDNLDELRTLLIQAGQLEQAVLDAWPAPSAGQRAVRQALIGFSDAVASFFLKRWTEASLAGNELGLSAQESLTQGGVVLPSCREFDDCIVRVKVPEGFQFYALFPEQYASAALAWAQSHEGTWPKRVFVLGILSIGTTLSAVVKATLEARGWRAERVTVRPTGHPFARQVRLSHDLSGIKCGVVLDEGPGLSGSSMAAAAQALAAAGVNDISFLPGHGGEPGAAASDPVRHWWARTPRFLTPLDDLRWNGKSLTDCLLAVAKGLHLRGALLEPFTEMNAANGSYSNSSLTGVFNLSGGVWRRWVFPQEIAWPAIMPMFERMKFLCRFGDRPAILWKFAGLGCMTGNVEPYSNPVIRMVAADGSLHQLAPLTTFRGFMAMPWFPGERVLPGAARAKPFLKKAAQLIVAGTGPPMSSGELEASVARLAEMLYWNTKESLAKELAEKTRLWAEVAQQTAPGPSSGDGRMAPWEWLSTAAADLIKTDSHGHDCDHTLVGKQSVLWDVAGFIIEWDLPATIRELFVRTMQETELSLAGEALPFYEAAYAAFRLGFMTLGLSQSAEPAEQTRTERAVEFYRRKLSSTLNQERSGLLPTPVPASHLWK